MPPQDGTIAFKDIFLILRMKVTFLQFSEELRPCFSCCCGTDKPPKKSLHCPGLSHALEMGTGSTCLFPMSDCGFEILLLGAEPPAISLANGTAYMHGMSSRVQLYFV